MIVYYNLSHTYARLPNEITLFIVVYISYTTVRNSYTTVARCHCIVLFTNLYTSNKEYFIWRLYQNKWGLLVEKTKMNFTINSSCCYGEVVRRLCMGQIPNTMMLRAVQEIYHSSFRIPLSLRLHGIRKLVMVYFLYRTQHHCISYII